MTELSKPCRDHGQKGNVAGYGYTSRGGKSCLMHRVVYAESLSMSVHTMGGVVMHACDNTRCVEPTHLSLGTSQDNSTDMARKGRCKAGEAHHATTLTWEQVADIRARYRPRVLGSSGKCLAAEYNVARMVISDIIRGVSWNRQ